MPFYTGKSADVSDAVECHGGYINPDNPNEWCSVPYPKQRKWMRDEQAVLDYMNAHYTLRDVYDQIQAKTCPLPRSLRDYVLSHFDSEGNFIIEDENETN
jgi:hypothetical protein